MLVGTTLDFVVLSWIVSTALKACSSTRNRTRSHIGRRLIERISINLLEQHVDAYAYAFHRPQRFVLSFSSFPVGNHTMLDTFTPLSRPCLQVRA